MQTISRIGNISINNDRLRSLVLSSAIPHTDSKLTFSDKLVGAKKFFFFFDEIFFEQRSHP